MEFHDFEERLQAARAAAAQGKADRRVHTTRHEAEASRIAQEEAQQSAGHSEANLRAAAAEIDRQVEAGRLKIRTALENARGEVEAIAAEAAQDIVRQLIGITVDKHDAGKAVKLDLNC